ncbi:MAG: hypothetical protein CMI16_09735 [Opitutaceae bacterium]|nr:hypothetical protein [Opitutaceae bacterium]
MTKTVESFTFRSLRHEEEEARPIAATGAAQLQTKRAGLPTWAWVLIVLGSVLAVVGASVGIAAAAGAFDAADDAEGANDTSTAGATPADATAGFVFSPSTPPSPPPPIQPSAPPGFTCSNACVGGTGGTHDNDGICDDGGAGAEYYSCQIGTDCADCGVRYVSPPPPTPPTPPPSPPPPTLGPNCMPYIVAVTNDGSSYYIDGATTDRDIGPHRYTFTGVPTSNRMRLMAHGTGAYGCVPTIVNTDTSTGGSTPHYSGTVVYDFSACSHQQSSEFHSYSNGRMNSGKPRLTVKNTC